MRETRQAQKNAELVEIVEMFYPNCEKDEDYPLNEAG